MLYSADKESILVDFANGKRERICLPYDPDLLPRLLELSVPVDYEAPSTARWLAEGLMRASTPLLAFGGLVYITKKTIEEPDDDFMSPKIKKALRSTGTGLDDVAGIDPIREEVEELARPRAGCAAAAGAACGRQARVRGCGRSRAQVRYLRDAEKYLRLGAQLPAGVLMVGPPGTGKTLLARAIAGEAGVPFFFCAGSEFMEMFVGVGASRVRNLFEQARKERPCIIFIDEFDAIGVARQSGDSAFGNEETANTINQLLTEMDGFEDNSGLVVLAATNRPAVLDKALTRPGRFDRVLRLPLPDLTGRVQIMKVHARGKAVAGDLDWRRCARACAGWSGADLEALMNEAAISSIRGGKGAIDTAAVFDAIDNLRRDAASGQLMLGVHTADMEESVAQLGGRVRAGVAAYAAGKALMAHMLPWYDEVQKITLFPGGQPDCVVTTLPLEENLDAAGKTYAYMQAELMVGLAGRAAAALQLGPENGTQLGRRDLEAAGDVARVMVLGMGLSACLGPVSYIDAQEEVFLASEARGLRRRVQPMSRAASAAAYAECVELLRRAEGVAIAALRANWGALVAVSDALLERRVLRYDEFAQLCEQHGVSRFPSPEALPEAVRYDASGRVKLADGPLPGAGADWPMEIARDPALMAAVKGLPWAELPAALEEYARQQAEGAEDKWAPEAWAKRQPHDGFKLWA